MSDPQLANARARLGHVLKDRWVLEDVLGVGGMAAVYSARHRNGARAAIKLLHGPLIEDQVVRERFLREAYLANSLDHIGTVQVLDDDADSKLGPYLVMELLDGSSILELLDKGVSFTVPVALDIADQTLDVLAIAHDKGIVHRDLKPANLFLCRNGQVKVLDFGIARVLDANKARLTRTGVPLGTPAYMAPEQARGMGRDADGRADIYALGATLFRMLAGRHVHVGRGAEQIALVATTRAPKLLSVAPQVPPAVGSVIDRSLEFEQARRYDDARAMREDIRALIRSEIPPIASRPLPPVGQVPGVGSPPRKRKDSEPIPGAAPKTDDVAELADSLRKRAQAAARRPDAFRVLENPVDEMDEDEEDMPTVVGSPLEMEMGNRPLLLAELRKPPPVPKRSRSLPTGRAAAAVFASIPNVPVPQRPQTGTLMPASKHPTLDDDSPTVARSLPSYIQRPQPAAGSKPPNVVGRPLSSFPPQQAPIHSQSAPTHPGPLPSVPPPVPSQPISSRPVLSQRTSQPASSQPLAYQSGPASFPAPVSKPVPAFVPPPPPPMSGPMSGPAPMLEPAPPTVVQPRNKRSKALPFVLVLIFVLILALIYVLAIRPTFTWSSQTPKALASSVLPALFVA